MFSKLKLFFSKKEAQYNEQPIQEMSLTFQDSKLQNIEINLKPAGNDTVLTLTEKKSGTEIALDQELCFVISNILQEYAIKGNINKVIKLLKSEEN